MVRGVPLRAALLGAGAAFVLALGPATAQDMKAEVDALKKRVAELESGTSVTVSGYAKGDFYIDSDNDLKTTFDVSSIRLDGQGGDDANDGSFGAHAMQSRVRVAASTEDLNTVVEGHFFGAGGTFALRHAYGEIGPVIAGQTWSILADEDTYPDTVDFNGLMGTISFRRMQVRLNLPLGEGFVGQMAVEEPLKDQGNELPAFAAALRYRSGWGAVNVSAAAGRVDEGAETVTAYALHFGAHANATPATRILATINTSRGHNVMFGGGDGAVDVSGELKAQDTIGGFAGVTHSWSDSIRSGLYYSWVENEASGGHTPDDMDNKSLSSVHANVFWNPVSQATIGFELIHGWREVHGGATGEATRFQIGVQYSF